MERLLTSRLRERLAACGRVRSMTGLEDVGAGEMRGAEEGVESFGRYRVEGMEWPRARGGTLGGVGLELGVIGSEEDRVLRALCSHFS